MHAAQPPARVPRCCPASRSRRGCDGWRSSQADLAIELVAGDGARALERSAVHETRKALKRLRALVRLLREELGEQAFAARERCAARRAAAASRGRATPR